MLKARKTELIGNMYIATLIFLYVNIYTYIYKIFIIYTHTHTYGASWVVLVVKNPPANAGDIKRCKFNPWVGKIPWRRA